MSAQVNLAEALQAMHDMAMHLAIVEQGRDAAVARAETAETAFGAWRTKCDEVGVPHDPDGLVRHHIGNAKLLGYLTARNEATEVTRAAEDRATTAETALAAAQADNTRLRDGILRAMEVAPTNTYQVLHVLLASTTGANE